MPSLVSVHRPTAFAAACSPPTDLIENRGAGAARSGRRKFTRRPIAAMTPRVTDGVRPLAEHRRVGDEPAVLAPHMELIAGRFVHEPQRRLSGEVKAKLRRRARGGACDRAGKTAD